MSKCSMWTQKSTSEKWKFNSNNKLGLEWLWMDWENHLEKIRFEKSKKQLKSEWNCRMWTKNHYRETELLFKHRFLTLLKNWSEKNSRRKTTRFFAPFPVSAWPKSLLQFDFKNH